ncbi:MAG: hypothetical protein AAB919_03035 [Patescibacteria group bacterium]|mgnify:CR=1
MPTTTKPRGWEGEGLPATRGPGAGNPAPKIQERFPVAFANGMAKDYPKVANGSVPAVEQK